MCLPDFIEFKQIRKSDPMIGYRAWRNPIKDNFLELIGLHQNYIWTNKIISHKVTESDSGIYAYNYNNYNYYYNYYYNNNYNYYYNHYYNHYYNIGGIIHQYGKVAIHSTGQRSQYARIQTLFTIRKLDAQGPEKFLDWIDQFNNRVEQIAKRYGANTMHWQDRS